MNQLKYRERGGHDRKCKQIQSSLLKMLEDRTGLKNWVMFFVYYTQVQNSTKRAITMTESQIWGGS